MVECTACECKVGIGPDGAGWSTHISGITHRRILLALGNGLPRSEIVVSMFEDTSTIGARNDALNNVSEMRGGVFARMCALVPMVFYKLLPVT